MSYLVSSGPPEDGAPTHERQRPPTRPSRLWRSPGQRAGRRRCSVAFDTLTAALAPPHIPHPSRQLHQNVTGGAAPASSHRARARSGAAHASF